MADKFNTKKTSETTNEWLTPPPIIEALGPFDLDPCAPRRDVRPWPTAANHFTGERGLFDEPNDPEAYCGLTTPWTGRVWLNPPYGDNTFLWIEKLAQHKSGIALIFARTDTIGFHDEIFRKAHALFFFEGRISFYRVDGTLGDGSGAPSVLVSYSEHDTKIIAECRRTGKLKGAMVFL